MQYFTVKSHPLREFERGPSRIYPFRVPLLDDFVGTLKSLQSLQFVEKMQTDEALPRILQCGPPFDGTHGWEGVDGDAHLLFAVYCQR